jgi:outer membrane lipoprotein-sorting protein
MRNAGFPHPFIQYKELGIAAKLVGKDKAGTRDAYVIEFDPPAGAVVRQYIDAENFLPIRTVTKVDVPQLGQEVEQTTEYSDHRDVDGVKVPFQIRASSNVQTITVTVSKVEHNVALDEAQFSKPKG